MLWRQTAFGATLLHWLDCSMAIAPNKAYSDQGVPESHLTLGKDKVPFVYFFIDVQKVFRKLP